MVVLSYSGGVGRGLEALGIGLNQAVVAETAAGSLVLARSGVDGGLVALRFNAAGQAQILDSQVFSASVAAAETVALTVLDTAEGDFVAVARNGANRLLGYQLLESGIGPLQSLTGDGLGAMPGGNT